MMNKRILYFEKDAILQQYAKQFLGPWGYTLECVTQEKVFLDKIIKETYDAIFVHEDASTQKSFHRQIHMLSHTLPLTWALTKDSGEKALPHLHGCLDRYVIDSPVAREQHPLVNLLLYDCDKQFGDALEKYVTAETLCQVMRADNSTQFVSFARQIPVDFGFAIAPQQELESIKPDLEKIVGVGFYLHPSELRGPFIFSIDHLYRRYKLFGPAMCLVTGKRI